MATKQVGVRLSASGGDQVRRELNETGAAGEKAFKKIPREVQRANAKLAAFGRAVKFAAVGAATAAAAGAVAATNGAMERAFEVQKQAAVANADPEVFQGWAAGAQTVGVEADKLSDILKDVNDRVGDFVQTGGGPMADFFENIAPKVGVTADQFARLSGPEALQLYVSSLEKAGVNSQEMTFYLEAMASDATALVPLLRNNGAEMATLAARAADLGVVMDRKTIAALNRSRTALVAVGQVMTGMGNKIGAAFAPVLEGLAQTFVNLASSTGPIGKALDALTNNIGRIMTYAGTFAALMAGKWVAGMAAAAAAVIKTAGALTVLRGALARTGVGLAIVAIGELGARFLEMQTGAGAAEKSIGDLDGKIDPLVGNMRSLQVVNDNLVLSLGDEIKQSQLLEIALGKSTNMSVAAAQKKLSEAMSRNENVKAIIAERRALALGSDDYADVLRRIQETQDALNATGFPARDIAVPMRSEAFEQLQQRLVVLHRERAEMLRSDEEMTEQLRRTTENIDAIETALAAAKDGMVSFGDEIVTPIELSKRLAAALAAAGGAAEDVKEKLTGFAAAKQSLKDYADTAMDFGKGVGGALVNAFQNAESAFRSFVETGKFDFKGLVRSILSDLAVLAFKRAVLGPLANALSGALGFGGAGSAAATAAVAHSGAVAGITGSRRSVPIAAFAAAPRMHSGGWAGLRPDEVPTILQRGERVLSRSEVAREARSSRGGDVSVSIDARGAQMGVAEQIDRQLRALLPEIRRVAVDAVADGRRRGVAL